MNLKRILSVILALAMIIGTMGFTAFAEDANNENTIAISSLEDLQAFRDAVNTGDNYAGKTVTLTADIDMSSVESWTPIGNATNIFLGSFDGNNKTISNLTVNQSGNYAGLFGYVKGAGMTVSETPTIKDLTLTNVSVKGNYYVGAIAGQSYTCRISNVHVAGNVEGVRYVGGVSGHVYTYIDNSSFTGNVSGSFDAIGGIAGAGDGRIYDCRVTGDITGSNWVGGIIANGQEGTSIVNCYVEGDVTTSNNYYWGIGGIAGVAGHGYSNGKIENNYFNGEVYIGNDKVNTPVIGLVNADNNESIKSTIGGNSWNTEYYPSDMKVVVTAEVSANMSAEDYAASGELQARNNNLVMLESDLEYIDATSMDDVIIMSYSNVTEEAVEEAVETNAEIAKNTVVISTVADLQAFADAVNAGNTYEGKTVVLANDIDFGTEMTDDEGYTYLEIADMTPIGTYDHPFKGTFDGQGHTISNLYITRYEDDGETFADSYIGLFGVINSPAVVKNVTVHNPYLVGKSYVGGIVGCAYTGAIENCHVTGEIDIEGHYMVGGITGQGYAKITNCSVIGAADWDYNYIGAIYLKSDLEGDKVGGIVGHKAENTTISGCRVENVTVEGTRSVGGITGLAFMDSKIMNNKVKNVTVRTTSTTDYADSNIGKMGIGGVVGVFEAKGSSNGLFAENTIENLTLENENSADVSMGVLTGGFRDRTVSPNTIGELKDSMTVAANNVTGTNTGNTNTFADNSDGEYVDIWVTNTDSGLYGDKSVAMMRFLFSLSVTDALNIEKSGIKYIAGNDISATVKGESSVGTEKHFYGDITNVPASETGNTYYAVAYITTETGKTYWSNPLGCSVNTDKFFSEYNGGNN